MLFIPHLIVNERNAISSSFPLCMEPRRLLSSEQTQALMALRTFVSLPRHREGEKAATVTRAKVTNSLLPQVGHLQQKPRLERRMHSALPSVSLSR